MARAVLMAARSVSRTYNEFLKESGLQVTQFSVLMSIRAGRYATLTALAEQLALERTTLLRNLELLRRQGLVADEPTDRGRSRRLALTAEGEALVMRCVPSWRQAQDALQAALGKQDADDLRAGLRRLRRAADAMTRQRRETPPLAVLPAISP
jgi:DNA-binding MarR family transcriptional regulator